ncbi:MAG: hypothetical protein K6F63_01920 [Lachnospiraceae bacterium]|nr:hypothetical protein [Lachnospiraceae bacterium]
MKSIFFSGTACEDLIMHMAKLLAITGNETAISDEDGNYSFSEIPIVDREETSDHPGFLLINGVRKPEEAKEADYRILVTDLQPCNARRLRKITDKETVRDWDMVILRDPHKNERAGKYIMNLLKLRCPLIMIRESDEDFALRCCMQEGIRYRLKGLGKEMLKGLFEAAKEIAALSDRDLKRALRRERRWERSLNSGPVIKQRGV